MAVAYIGSSGTLLVQSISQLLTFAILARSLGVSEFSVFITLNAVMGMAVFVCGLGAQEALVRRVARDTSEYPRFLGHNIIAMSVTGAILLIVGVAILPFFFQLVPDLGANLALIGVLILSNVVVTRFVLFTEQVFVAHSRFGEANMIIVQYALLRLVAISAGCLVFGVTTVEGWVICTVLAHAAMGVLCIRALSRLGAPRFYIARDEIANGLLVTSPFVLRSICQNIDLIMLSIFTSAEIVGSYGIARRILDSAYLPIEALARLLYPGSALASAGGLHLALRRFQKVLVASLVISVGAVLVIVVASPLLPMLFGAEYVSLQLFACILAPTVILVAIYSTAQEALGASGRHLPRALVFNGGLVLGAALVVLLTWLDGVRGTFVAAYLTEAGIAVAAWLILLRIARQDAMVYQAAGSPAQ